MIGGMFDTLDLLGIFRSKIIFQPVKVFACFLGEAK
jgi:hypothetical protein